MRPPPPLPSPCLLVDLPPQGLLLLLPPWAPLEEVVPCLCRAPAPPALGLGADLSPVQVLSCAGVSRLQLVEPRGEPLGTVGHRAIGFPALRHAVLRLRGPTSGPLTCLRPLFL